MLRNSALADWITSNPLLVAEDRISLFAAHLTHLSADGEFQKLFAANAGDDDKFWNPYGEGQHPYRPYVVTNGILQVPVQGVLLNKFSYQFGRYATGYQYIEKAVMRGLSDPAVKGIALIMDSPGGEVAGCFELSDKLFEAREGKPIRAYSMDHAYSAAYALASAATEVIVSRSGGTGSVGVLTAHADYSGALAQIGIKVTFIFAGAHKVDGNAYEALPKEVKDRIQNRIDKIYGVFTGTVARNRNMDEAAVRKTEALTYDADDSVTTGFADRIGALDEELVAFADSFDEAGDEQLSAQEDTMTPEQIQAAIASARAEGVTEGTKAGAEAERTRVAAIMGSEPAKSRPTQAAKLVTKGLDAETAIELLADYPEEKAQTTAPAAGTGTTPFDRAMDTSGNPNVGADPNAGAGAADPDAAAIEAVASIAGTYKGHKPKAA